ncbi:MAG: caspase family protein [Desulfobacterales bacterium]
MNRFCLGIIVISVVKGIAEKIKKAVVSVTNMTSNAFMVLQSLLIIFIQYGCLSAPEIYPSETASNSVRVLKYLRVFPGGGKFYSGVELSKDDIVSAVVSGKIQFRQGGREEGPYLLRAWIGNEIYGSPFTVSNGATFSAPNPGKLYFVVGSGSSSQSSSGYFDLTIVVWRTKNYAEMIPFLKILKSRAQNQDDFQEAVDQANVMLEIESAKKQTSDKIEITKSELARIQGDVSKGDYTATQQADRIEEIQKRLEVLTQKLSVLDALSSQLDHARNLNAELNRRLQEFDKREKEFSQQLSMSSEIVPRVLISSPEENEVCSTSSIWLKGVVENANGVVQVDLIVNGQRIPLEEIQMPLRFKGTHPVQVNVEKEILLQNGPNKIEIFATSTTGLQGKKSFEVQHKPARRNIYAVVVGINDYPKFPKLKYAVNDAREFLRFLVETNNIPTQNITVLINEEATITNLRSALGTTLRTAAGPADMALIFFAGHGTTEPDSESADGDGVEKYLLAYDTIPGDLYSTGLPMREVSHIVKRIKSECLILIADACYSGAAGGRTVNLTGARSRMDEGFLEKIVQGKGKVVLTASAANEVSIEKDELRHGVFTYYLLEGLRGAADADRDGMVTVDEAYRYVSEEVPRATGQEQHPVKKGEVEGKLVLSVFQ